MLAGPNDYPPSDFMQAFDLEEIPSQEAHPMTTDSHDTNNPTAVTAELMKPFPPSALFDRQGLTYVQYQQVIRRLIHATGNTFQVEVTDLQVLSWPDSNKGVPQRLLMAQVKLTIPNLGSRTATGVQVVSVGFGEDFYKGAVSDGLKKAAQMFGVAIELAGKDGEDTNPNQYADVYTPGRTQETHTQYQQQRQQPRPAPQAPRPQAQRQGGGGYSGPQRGIGEGGPASDAQKNAIHKMAGKAQVDVNKLLYDETNGQEDYAQLSKGTASHLIDLLKTILDS